MSPVLFPILYSNYIPIISYQVPSNHHDILPIVFTAKVITAMLPNITDSFHLYLLLGRNREAIDR